MSHVLPEDDPGAGGRIVTVLVGLLVLTALVTALLDLIVFDAWVPEAVGLSAVLAGLAAWTATRSVWAPAIVGCIAALATVVNLLSPFVGPRLFDPAQFAFFVTTWVATASGLLAAPFGIVETARRRQATHDRRDDAAAKP